MSCSYGPGRYDSNYEDAGNDYPLPFVRWTEKRNFESVLNAISNKLINVNPLISEKIPINDFDKVYENIGNKRSIASILVYDINKKYDNNKNLKVSSDKNYTSGKPLLGIIGAGNFTSSMILPKLKRTGVDIKSIASSKGLSGTILANKYSIENSTTDFKNIIDDNEINLVLITTQHGSHSNFVCEALKKNKCVFVEKPLSTTWEGLNNILSELEKSKAWLTVGFNRRFAPLAQELKKRISPAPMNIIANMNAGYIPPNLGFMM